MSAPFTVSLRARPDTIRLGVSGEPAIALRVQVPEVWDAVRIEAPVDTTVAAVKSRALAALMPNERDTGAFLVKLDGIEVLDEEASLAACGATAGSILLVTGRRRRPVR
jgi:hypothetical protein